METCCCTGHWAQHVFPVKAGQVPGWFDFTFGGWRCHHLLSIKPYVKHIEQWDILQINWLNRISSNNSIFQNISRSKRYIQPSRTWKVDAISLCTLYIKYRQSFIANDMNLAVSSAWITCWLYPEKNTKHVCFMFNPSALTRISCHKHWICCRMQQKPIKTHKSLILFPKATQ